MSDLVYQNYNNKCQGWVNPSNQVYGPHITSLSGYQSPAGSHTIISINGSGFYSYSSVLFGTYYPNVYFINSNILQFYVPSSLSSGTFPVQVFNGSYGSNIVTYTIDNASGYWLLNPSGSISNTNLNNTTSPPSGGGLSVNGPILQTLNGIGSTSIGTNSLPIVSSGPYNTIVGNNCGNSLTSGGYNTFLGQQSGIVTTTGQNNTFLGQQTGWSNINGNQNVYIGEHSGYNATGNNNTCVGQSSGSAITNGINNTCIGQGSNVSLGTISTSTAIGYGAIANNNNQIVLGTSAEHVYIPSTLTQPSGYALNVMGDVSIAGNCYATAFNPPSDYRIKLILDNLTIDKEEYNIDNLKPIKYSNIKNGHTEIGFLAHEVQEIFPYLVSGEKDGEQLQTLNYMGLIGILVKEIQTLKQDIKSLKQTNK